MASAAVAARRPADERACPDRAPRNRLGTDVGDGRPGDVGGGRARRPAPPGPGPGRHRRVRVAPGPGGRPPVVGGPPGALRAVRRPEPAGADPRAALLPTRRAG